MLPGSEENRQALLDAKGIRKEFFRKGRNAALYFNAVKKCDFTLNAGELVVLMGRSGSGKSTLMSMLSGLLAPTEGAVSFRGTNLYEISDAERSRLRNKHFGTIPQGQTPIHSISVVQNVMMPFALYGNDPGLEERAFELLGTMGIAELADSYPSELSGGELRRMSIARSLICDPDIVFADEPTGDLDDENTTAVLEMLRGVADSGSAVLVVTHEPGARSYANRVLRMDGGVLRSDRLSE